jgi:hypothetical protein
MKKYKTRNGLPARIICDDANNEDYPVVALITTGRGAEEVQVFTAGLRFHTHKGTSELDLIEVTEWDDFEIDDKVLVKDHYSDDWSKRYFAGVIDKKPTIFDNGSTQYSNRFAPVAWKYCHRYEEKLR